MTPVLSASDGWSVVGTDKTPQRRPSHRRPPASRQARAEEIRSSVEDSLADGEALLGPSFARSRGDSPTQPGSPPEVLGAAVTGLRRA
jgi:hypothetical protein